MSAPAAPAMPQGVPAPEMLPVVGQRLPGKVCVITGSASGIGRGIALHFAKQGAVLALLDMNEAGLRETKALCEAEGARCQFWICNISQKADVDRVVEEIKTAFGTIDVLVNNAGISQDNLMLKMTEAQWDAVLNVNLKGVFLMTQACGKVMKEKNYGSIVNISSIVGKSGNIGVCNYAASKAGVLGFTKAVAKEMCRFRVRCNAILPGFVMTPLISNLPAKVVEGVYRDTPLGRMGQIEEIARAVCFMACDDSSYCTGAQLEVSGGMFM